MNLVDIAKREDPSGVLAKIAEILNESNDIVKDMPMMPSNAPFGHRVTMRSSLPSVAFSKINKGVSRSKGSTKQQVDTIGMLVAMSEVDAKLKDVVVDFEAKRHSDDAAFLESFTQEVASTIVYGNELTEEDGFTGLSERMDALQTSSYTSSYVKGHHSSPGSDMTSIYVCDWGPNGVHGIYPPAFGSGGLAVDDLGKQRVQDDNSAWLTAFVTEYKWYVGLSVEDPRHIARLANIDISQAKDDTAVSLVKNLGEVFDGMAARNGMRRVAYCRRELLTAIRNQVYEKANLTVSIAEYLGELRPFVHGVPLVAVDQISATETELS
jgi:hypothetical protein